jgi:hypothetical protein
MPEISRFFGIVIKMYLEDHPPPHFHAEYGEHEALLDIHALVVIGGRLPPRVQWVGCGVGIPASSGVACFVGAGSPASVVV